MTKNETIDFMRDNEGVKKCECTRCDKLNTISK